MSETRQKTAHIDRRSFLKGLLAAPIVASPLASSYAAGKGTDYSPDQAKDFHSYLYDETKCIGCKACVNNCITVNSLPQALELSSEKKDKWQKSAEVVRNQVTPPETKMVKEELPELSEEIALTDINTSTGVKGFYVKEQCMHCLHPSCVSACPVSAMIKDPKTGAVYNDPDKCIGCRYCMVACPFNIIKFEWSKVFPKIRKCTLCRETNLKDGKGIPACVTACPGGALLFGKRDQVLKIAKRRVKQNPGTYLQDKVYGETEGGGTSVFVLADSSIKSFKNINLPDPKTFQKSPAETTEKIQGIYTYGIAPVVVYAAFAVAAFINNKKSEEE